MELDLSGLNKQQKEAVIHENGPLLIVAGAGTGKTTVVSQRVAWLIQQELATPEEILCLTFTDKAAGEMVERIDSLLPYGYTDLWVMTFHSFCERILKQYGVEIGLSSHFKLLDETTQWMLLHDNIDKFDLDYYKPMGNPTKFISAMLTHFSKAKDESVFPEDYLDYIQDLKLNTGSAEFAKFAEIQKDFDDVEEAWTQEMAKKEELAKAYFTYQKILAENDSLDFGDLILYTKKLLQDRPSVLQKLREQFKYVLVDEFQDTNYAQYDLVKMLAAPNNNVTVVGDDDQSVYKFRGASISNILGFMEDYPDAKQVVLTTNYRSCQEILDLSYKLIEHNNPDRLEYRLNEGAEENKLQPISKKLTAFSEDKAIVEHLHFSKLQEEAHGVVQKILALKEADKNLSWSDVAILVRANSHADPFVQELTVTEIPYQFMASQGLFSKPIILDVLAYFDLLDHYHESDSLYRILILPTVNVSNADLMVLLHHSRRQGQSLYASVQQADTLEMTDKGKDICRRVLTFIDLHSTIARTQRVSEVGMSFMDDFGLKRYIEEELDPLQQKEMYEYLNQFWRLLKQFETEAPNKTLQAFKRYFALIQQAGDQGRVVQDLEDQLDSVKIMTIHGSKGLEFKHVFLVNLVDRRFPTSTRPDALPLPNGLVHEPPADKESHLREERRLAYVALTRAKKGLYLVSSEDYGGARKKKYSRFLFEMEFPEKAPESFAIQWGTAIKKNPESERLNELDLHLFLPKHFSYTQYKTFQTCPWQYRYAFIMKIPVMGKYTFSFGKTMHNTLERFFNEQKEQSLKTQGDLFGGTSEKSSELSLDYLLEMYEEAWIDEWYFDPKQKDIFKEKGRDILKEFYKVHHGNWPETEQTEKPFTLKIGNHTLKGSMDRVDIGEDGAIKIVDYKTGSVPKSDRSMDKDQLLLYQIAAEEVFGQKVEELTYYYLNENVAKSFLGTDKQKEKIKEKIVKTFDELKSSNFEAKPSKQICKNCDFRSICPYKVV